MFKTPALGASGLGSRGIGAPALKRMARSDQQQGAFDLRDAQAIFAAEPALLGGIWLPDLAMMKQDSAGQTNAAVAAVVGLVYDQSKGVALGPELVTNGTFDVDSGWTKNTGWSIGDGVASYNGSGGLSGIFSPVSVRAGGLYKVTLTVISNTGTLSNTIYLGSSNIVQGAHLVPGSYVFYTGSVSGANYIYLYGRPSEQYVIDNVSVKEVLGVHAIQPITTNKPLLQNNNAKYWFKKDSANTSLSATFSSTLGNSCTVYRWLPTGISILAGQSISTTYDLASTDWYGSIVLNRAVSPYEDRLFRRMLSRYTPI